MNDFLHVTDEMTCRTAEAARQSWPYIRRGLPPTRPAPTVLARQRLAHASWFDEDELPTKKAKPAGVLGAEIWLKIGVTPPADPNELSFLALDTNTPYLAQYNGAQAGKKAHSMLRWVSTRGDKGPWSETASATIGG
jgi:hypothetical protein